MKAICFVALAVAVGCSSALADPGAVKDLAVALQKAKTENKMLFVQIGRDDCSRCEALRALISGHEVQLSEDKYVWADVSSDDAATNKLFRETFKVIGLSLPFVVIAAPDGTQLAARSGYGTAEDYCDLLENAQAASEKPGKSH